MKTCNGCKFAKWERTKSGALHPSGAGQCTKSVAIPDLPIAFGWVSKPFYIGGYIERRRENPEHCRYFQREESPKAGGK